MRGWPKTFTIRGRTWSLKWLEGMKEKMEAFGYTLNEDQSVTMDNRPLNPQQNAETLVHELLHVCYVSTSLPHVVGEDDKDKAELEETVVDGLAPAVLSLIVDNPELITRIQEEYEKGHKE